MIYDQFRSTEPMRGNIHTLTVTIRHTDFWGWGKDSPLRIDGNGNYGEIEAWIECPSKPQGAGV
jgi:hypothetical protein